MSNRSGRSRGLAPVHEVDEAQEEKSNYASRKGSSRREGGQVEEYLDCEDNWSDRSTPRILDENMVEMSSMIMGGAPQKDEYYEGGLGGAAAGITPGSKMRPSAISVNDIDGSQRSAI